MYKVYVDGKESFIVRTEEALNQLKEIYKDRLSVKVVDSYTLIDPMEQ